MNTKLTDKLATGFFWAIGFLILGVLAWFLWYILSAGVPHLTPDFMFGKPEDVKAGGGVGPMLFNSFYILILSLLFSLPFGIGAGIWLAEYAKKNWFTDMVRLSTEMLASVPSIVFGLFGALLFVTYFGLGFTILGGALTLALLNLPVLVRVTEETLRAVPDSYREASLALGSTKWQMIRKVLIPTSLPGLVTGITLVAGRALGESAILIFTAGVSVSRFAPDFDLMASGATLSVQLWYIRSEALVPDAMEIAEGTAALLVLVVLLMNLLIALPSRYLQRKASGK
ncbi:phosphate ABC transporter membrane protein 2 (PhoT family) [Tumebacillus sp. BK434]|uniref:phosphate ABC transporter permease PstA n=1 Tax=Tumebacillus sp. BK434 TaxID=2512169 RepID=UPI001053289B|nr:phosphate ABC transporter permease PstA [Tumebacillus sp. BK434]TCP57820.1 phosphate ABC transporter membrane protein 2 (PhoT family) [Tumebacillus sp. BK434]